MSRPAPLLRHLALMLALLPTLAAAKPTGGNRLAYLDGPADPYYVGTGFARLATPQWVGEEGVRAVAILSIDDMREPAKYEAFLRPILDRLKDSDPLGKAQMSIFTCAVDPDDPQLQSWLNEGLSIEVHTIGHPCPLLTGGDFAAAKKTVDDCIDLLKGIPNMEPICFRMPCCDSMNSLSPRFFSEIFNRTTPRGSFLQSDSSMFVWFNGSDKQLPDLLAGERFSKYLPRLRGWVNFVENYPYPYTIGGLCWEFPSVIPSDWEAQNRHGANNPETVDDLKAALDATVIKDGLFTLVFHPHGWIRNSQVVELIDHAAAIHGSKVRFLNLREATGRLTTNMLAGQPLRKPDGSDNGVRILDLNNDGFMDVVIGNAAMQRTRLWDPNRNSWHDSAFPARLDRGEAVFGVLQENGYASVSVGGGAAGDVHRLYHFGDGGWAIAPDGVPPRSPDSRFRDLDGDGICEMVGGGAAYALANTGWQKLGFDAPRSGSRLFDADSDGDIDSVFSDAGGFEVRLFDSMATGWSIPGRIGERGDRDATEEIPPIVRADGSDNGAWFHGQRIFFQNEDSVSDQSQVISRTFEFLRTPLPEKVGVLESKPLGAEEALASIQTSLPFKVELAAAEPEVMDPIDMAWGIDGKLWVVEMADYPLGIDGEPGGRVRWLEDRDGDGRYERSVVFADALPFPTGVMPWRDGVLIIAAPDLIFAQDRDGDGVADHRETLYTGFGQGNQQHRVNGLRWGLDNWIYLANGDSNGVIKSLKTGETLDISGRDLRIRPDSGEMEAQSGRTQYGRNRDDWGNWFGCNNSNPMWHFVLDDHYLKRNPHFAPPPPTTNLVRSEGRLQLYPSSQPLERFNDYDNLRRITSACGAMIYRDDLLGPGVAGNAFVCEPVHNLVLRLLVEPDGYSFVGGRGLEEQQGEFFRSSDPWCRPVAIHTGPDGCLWVADMYRLVIEHPEWIPQEWQAKLDLRSGQDRGRIYRIRPREGALHDLPRLAGAPLGELVALLESTNGTRRDLAHQALLWRSGERVASTPLLTGLLETSGNPLARLHALCVLDGIGGLEPRHLARALGDAHPGVRRHAVRLCESLHDPQAKAPPYDLLAKFTTDPDPQLRLQLALSLGEFGDATAGVILADLAIHHGANPSMAAAVMSSAIPHLDALTAAMPQLPEPLKRPLLATIAKEGNQQAILESLSISRDFESAAVLLEALTLPDASRIQPLVDAARAAVFDTAPPSIAAIRLLGTVGETAQLDQLLTPESSPEVQAAAVGAIASVPVLLRNWTNHSPALRAVIANSLARNPANADPILGHFAQSPQAGRAFLDFLIGHPDPAIRERARQLFQQGASTRGEVIGRYRQALGHDPDVARGRDVFQQVCSSCHELDGIGRPVGPDLRTLSNKSPDALLAAIIDPNRAVEDKFLTYVLQLRDGSARAGMVASETSAALTLTLPDGSIQAILRSDLKSIQSTGRSLMPEGLEASVAPDAMRDLIAWISAPRAKPRPFAGNDPKTITSSSDGTYRLEAAHASIYGESLVFEQRYKNLGYWGHPDDHAVWAIDCPGPGRYEVELDFACAADVAGNTFRLDAADSTLTGSVPSTGSWDNYERRRIGQITLSEGTQQLTLRAAGPIRGSLIDLKTVILTPLKG